jgi:hypothetical protein
MVVGIFRGYQKTNKPTITYSENTMSELNSEKRFQHYAYAKAATQMITPLGKKFSFVANTFITDDKEIMEYLDDCIDSGMKEITKGSLLTAKDADPMRAVKDAAIAEYKAELAEKAKNEALGNFPDMGIISKEGAAKLGAVSTRQLINAGVSSTSGKSTGAK